MKSNIKINRKNINVANFNSFIKNTTEWRGLFEKYLLDIEAKQIENEEKKTTIKFMIKKNKNQFKKGNVLGLEIPRMVRASHKGVPSVWEFGDYELNYKSILEVFELSDPMFHYRMKKWGIDNPEMWYFENCHIKHINTKVISKMLNRDKFKNELRGYALNSDVIKK